jgi:tetrahydromethanopterin S-methyltransferase subunit B
LTFAAFFSGFVCGLAILPLCALALAAIESRDE